MKKATVITSIIATTLMCGAVLYTAVTEHKLYDLNASDYKTLSLDSTELAKYTTSAEGSYKLHEVFVDSAERPDYSFRIPLANGTYANGVLLCSDCGGQVVNSLGNFSMTRTNNDHDDTFNFLLCFNTQEIVSASIDFTFNITPTVEMKRFFGTFTTVGTIGDEWIADNYDSNSLPANISRDIGTSGNCHDLLWGDSNNTNYFTPDNGEYHTPYNFHEVNESGGNTLVYKINGAVRPSNSTISFVINSLTINYRCTTAA